ncbi:MAG: S8 family serine peptidase, partial [Rhabdaerophilum sp.]
RIAPFSSSGPTRDGRQKPDLVAPGVGILAARSRSPRAPAGGQTRKSGASQAAPHVAGAIALVFEAAGRPLSIHETRAAVIGTAHPERSLAHEPLRAGAGLLDVPAAIGAARHLAPSRSVSLPPAAEEIDMNQTVLAYSPRMAHPAMGDSAFPENPAVIAGLARAGAALGAAGDALNALDKAIEFVQRRVFTGAFSLRAPDAQVIPFPVGLGTPFEETRIFKLRCVQPVLSDDIMAFAVTIHADCYNIYNIAIVRHEAGSAFLINSTLSLEFNPTTRQVPGTIRPNVPFYITGRWDPTGPGNEDFRGRLLVHADGAMELSLQAPGGRVRIEGTSRYGAARACPAPVAPDPGTPGPVPVLPPDQRGGTSRPPGGGGRPPGGGGRATPYPDCRQMLPTSPTQIHVFFLTSNTGLTVNETNRLQTWLNQMGTAVMEQIRNGGVPVFVTGHASRSGNEVQNMELSTRRARAAAEALRGLVGPNANIRFQGQGSRESVGQHPNDQADRRATIRIQLPG